MALGPLPKLLFHPIQLGSTMIVLIGAFTWLQTSCTMYIWTPQIMNTNYIVNNSLGNKYDIYDMYNFASPHDTCANLLGYDHLIVDNYIDIEI